VVLVSETSSLDDCEGVDHVIRGIIVPLIAKLKQSTLLSSKLVFSVFPVGHPEERFVIDFQKVVQMDRYFDDFVTK
jgi:hypothetical protein